MVDYSKYNLDSYVAPVEEEDDGDVLDGYIPRVDYSKFNLDSYKPDLDKIDEVRKLQYGAAQEPMIAGSLYRLAKAGATAAFSEDTFREKLEKIEQERQEEILSEFQEFKGLREEDEDLTIIGGRVGTALVDPVTFLIPWAKFGKAGTLAAGAGLAAGETALREKALYGEVEAKNVAVNATIGAASSGLGLVIERLVRRGDVEKALDDVVPEVQTKPKTKTFQEVKTSLMESPIVERFLKEDGGLGLDEVVKDALDPASRSTVIMVTPKQFLNFAARGTEEAKLERVQKMGSEGEKFDVSFLKFNIDDKGRAVISGHEGRHRAMYYIEQGLGDELMPVRLTSGGNREIRFGEDKFRPDTLYNEDSNELFNIADRYRRFTKDEDDVFAGLTPQAIDDEISARTAEEAAEAVPFPKSIVFDITEPLEGSTIPRISGQPSDIAQDLTPEEVTDFSRAFENAGGLKPNSVGFAVFTQELIQSVRQIDKFLDQAKKAKRKTTDEAKLEKLKSRIKAQQKMKDTLLANAAKKAVRLGDEKVETNLKAIEKLREDGKLTPGIIRASFDALGRPLLGSFAGTNVGLFFMEDNDDMATLTAFTVAGLAGGAYWKRIHKSTKLTDLDKQSAAISIADRTGDQIAATAASASIPTKLAADGGWNKVIGNLLFSITGKPTDSVEARMIRNQSDYILTLNNIFKDSTDDESVATLVGEAMRGFTDLDKLSAGYKGLANNLSHKVFQTKVGDTVLGTPNFTNRAGVTQEQIDEARRILPQVAALRDQVAERMSAVGVTYKLEDDYGLAQRWNVEGADTVRGRAKLRKDIEEALTIQNANLGKKAPSKKQVDRIFQGVMGTRKFAGTARSVNDNSNSIFAVKRGTDGKITYKFRPLSEFFEKQRLLTDREAVKFLASKGHINLNSKDVMYDYGFQTIKVADFAETFGANGELINYALDATRKAFQRQGSEQELAEIQSRQQDRLVDAIEVFWGGYGGSSLGESAQRLNDFKFYRNAVRTFTTLANGTYLTGVTITNMADLLQPFVNSGFTAAVKGVTGKFSPDTRFSKMTSFKHDQAFEKELRSLLRTSTKAGTGRYENFLLSANDVFFRAIQLRRLNGIARNYAYDVGVNRAFELAKKSKLSESNIRELGSYNLSVDDLKAIGKYDDIKVAFEEGNARDLMDLAGRSAADRDAIVPLMGNRLYFTQSNDELVRSLGQFSSWAQAKSVQMNALADRVEGGDAAILVRLLASIPMAGMVAELKRSASADYTGTKKEDLEAFEEISKAMKASGNFENWALTRGLDALKYGLLEGDRDAMAQVAPSIAYLQDTVTETGKAIDDFAADDYEGVAKEIADQTPFLKQTLLLYKKMTGDYLLEDKDNEPEKKSERPLRLEKGGVVDVPRASEEPDERIDKMTGRPYDQQAGTAFVDEEDPLRRLGFGVGGEVDPLQRLGFGVAQQDRRTA